jgi:3-hydroxyacyl-CoA dehydrogenase / enoyl-CoA hydratase / 3-hydroxybutyryl-CoA epimerase
MSAFTTDTQNGIAVVTLDVPGAPVNTLSQAVKDEFDALFPRLQDDPAVRAIVLISGKPDNFIAGADIEEFTKVVTAHQAERLAGEGQQLIGRVAAASKPVVAAIHGACLGGGLELALACQYRIATDHPKTQLGLPEVQLGLLPAAGGCQRLPRLIGLRAALDIILQGKSERAQKAYKLGMIDELVYPAILKQTAIAAAERLARGEQPKREHNGGLTGLMLDRSPIGRKIVYSQAEKTILKKTGGHYPAPLAALEAVRAGLEDGVERGLEVERRRFGELAVGPVSRQLVRIFFATTALKKDNGLPEGMSAEPREVELVAVIGSGFMGSGIAGTAALNAKTEVRLRDTDLARVGKGIKAATTILDERLKRRRLTRPDHQRRIALLSGTTDYSGFGSADLVIEAVFEDLEVKRQVLAEVEAVVPAEAIFATNTSTIPIADIAANARRPQRVLGMHFFSPVEKMPLLEIIPTDRTSPEAIVSAVRFGRTMGKTVIVVADRPGFWVNRILLPYMNEAGHLLEEGVPVEAIDKAMTRFGFPVGPVTLLDEVGIDVGLKAGKVMYEAMGERLAPSGVVPRMVAAGRLGRKNGQGFYQYEDGRKADVDEAVYELLGVERREDVSPTTIEQRLVFSMLNEAARAAAEGVVRSPRDGDIGAIYGIGFPPFRGGPLRMIDDLGPARVVEILRALESEFGMRFAPAPELVAMAERGERFYRE